MAEKSKNSGDFALGIFFLILLLVLLYGSFILNNREGYTRGKINGSNGVASTQYVAPANTKITSQNNYIQKEYTLSKDSYLWFDVPVSDSQGYSPQINRIDGKDLIIITDNITKGIRYKMGTNPFGSSYGLDEYGNRVRTGGSEYTKVGFKLPHDYMGTENNFHLTFIKRRK